MQRKYSLLAFNFFLLLLYLFSACSGSDTTILPFGKNVETDIKTLSSDEMEGRAPASPGGIKAKEYIVSRFKEIGLQPANGDTYFQAVPLVEITGSNFSPLKVSSSDTTFSFTYLDDMVVGSYRPEESLDLTDSELIFVGYGIVAPEYGWNDYEGIDVRGKTVLVLVNDPGFVTGDPNLFTGKAMTYYGRWTYKFEEAARQGAAGALIIHQTAPASYDWNVVRNSWSGTQYGVSSSDDNKKLRAEGWIREDLAKLLFEEAGYDFESMLVKAAGKGFNPLAFNMNVSVSFDNHIKQSECHNIIGFIEGSEYPEESVIYMAHWDHLGMVETDDGVDIYNGAVDNATGVASIMSIAERFMSDEAAPRRSIVFMAVTAEESGLLGSQYYAENPLFSVAQTVAGINIDALNVYGPTRDIVSIGYGYSELEDYLERHAAHQNRVVKPNPNPEGGFFYRSDHFNLAKLGIPMIYANSGSDYIGKDQAYATKVAHDEAFRYHSPNDVIHDLWNYYGIYQDLWLFYNIGKELANNDDFPNWMPDNEFRAARDALAPHRRN